jgi:transcriptional regulator with XRE-family HTH domain
VPKKKPHMIAESFGARLAQVRKDAGLSQRDLAAQLGISARMVAYYEAQTDHPPARLLPALTEILGVSTDQLLGVRPIKEAKPNNQRLWRRFRQIEKLPPKDRRQLLGVIDAFLDAKKAS